MAQIFISYSRADKEFVQRLRARLRRKYCDEFWHDAEILGGDVVLLSPGGTSYNAYTDFAECGEHFRQLVMEL